MIKKVKKAMLIFAFSTTIFLNNKAYAYDILEYIDDLNDLHKYIPKSSEEFLENLNKNDNLSDEFKNFIKEFFYLVEEKYPNLDYTIFNYNIKNLKIYIEPLSEIQKENKKSKGYYNIYNNEIHIASLDEELFKYCLFHELWHLFNNVYLKDQMILKSSTNSFYGTALDEGITSYLTNSITNLNYYSYLNQNTNFEMLLEIYGNEIIDVYFNEGITGITNILTKDSSFNEANKFIKNMDKELKESNNDIISNYVYLINLFFSKNDLKIENLLNFENLLNSLDYDINIKKEILKLYKDRLEEMKIINDFEYVVFEVNNDSKVFLADELFMIKTSSGKFYVNKEIMKKYLSEGIIYNIYDPSTITKVSDPKIYLVIPFKEFAREYLLDAFYSENYLYIDVKSKVLTK